jgi:uncharacterized protein with NRDE domain
MCLLVLFFRVVPDAPVIVAANREEMYARVGEPPRILDGSPRAVGGVDPVAGGTWLGVNEHGVLVAVTNRPKSEPPPKPRSRGLLVRDLLACASASDAADQAAREFGGNEYAGCNLLCVDEYRAIVLHAGDWLRVRPLPSGIHVLTSHDVNDASDPRLGHALNWLAGRRYSNSEDCVSALQELCGQAGNGGPPICLHGEKSGTVSSSIVALRKPLSNSLYRHAQGPPDREPYADVSPLLHAIFERS